MGTLLASCVAGWLERYWSRREGGDLGAKERERWGVPGALAAAPVPTVLCAFVLT